MALPNWDTKERFAGLDEKVGELAPFVNELAKRNEGYEYIVILVDPNCSMCSFGNQSTAKRLSIIKQMATHNLCEVSQHEVAGPGKGN